MDWSAILEKYSSFGILFILVVGYLWLKKALTQKRVENRRNVFEEPEPIARLTVQRLKKQNPEMLVRLSNTTIIKELILFNAATIISKIGEVENCVDLKLPPKLVDDISSAFRNLALYIYVFFIQHENQPIPQLAGLKREIAIVAKPVLFQIAQNLQNLNKRLNDKVEQELVLKLSAPKYLESLDTLLFSKSGQLDGQETGEDGVTKEDKKKRRLDPGKKEYVEDDLGKVKLE
jgi:hypothetical protein